MFTNNHKIGGRAEPDGIIFHTKDHTVLIKQKDDDVIITKEKNKSLLNFKFLKFPFIRGLAMILLMPIEAIYFAFWRSKNEPKVKKGKKSYLEYIPELLSSYFNYVCFVIGFILGNYVLSTLYQNILYSSILLKIHILIAFVIFIVGFEDILHGKQTLQYHGAEHKIIDTYNHNKELSLENVKKSPKENIRCGSSFVTLFILLILFIPIKFQWWLFFIYLSIAYEMIDFGSKNQNNFIGKIIFFPGYITQKFLTREPTSQQMRMGIKGFKELLNILDNKVNPE